MRAANYDQRDSVGTSKRFAPEYYDTVMPYDNDAEMGDMQSYPRGERQRDMQALPPLPTPSSPSWLRPIRSMSPFPKQ
jgi:hypothetical protein